IGGKYKRPAKPGPLNGAGLHRHSIEIWRRSARVVWSASLKRDIVQQAIWPRISNAGWRGGRSLRVAFRRRYEPGAGQSVIPSLLLRRSQHFVLLAQQRSCSFLIMVPLPSHASIQVLRRKRASLCCRLKTSAVIRTTLILLRESRTKS